MVQESIKTALKKFGLTEKEIEVYSLLARMGVQKTGQIAKQLKINKGLAYRLLKNLQKKGVVEATLESPTRYTAIAFEKVIDAYIKSTREEAQRIEEAKNSLLSDWNRISQEELNSSLEKFGVIEGKKKIFKKISRLVKETRKQISIGLLISDFLDAERFDFFDTLDDMITSGKSYRILTQFSKQNLQTLKVLKRRINSALNFRGINPSLELSTFSRIVIKDNDEIVLFITDNQNGSSKYQKDVCLFTNCKSIIQAFSAFFEDLWKHSIKIEEGITQLETGKTIPEMHILKDPEGSKQKFEQILNETEDKLLIVSSSEGLAIFQKMLLDLKNQKRKVSIKIMVPIIENNLEIAQNLLKFCEVKHIASSYNETVIVDSKHLFQFKHPKLVSYSDFFPFFENALYTNDVNYIEKTKNMLSDLWLKATIPSNYKIDSILSPSTTPFENGDSTFTALKNFRRVVSFNIEKDEGPDKLTEKDVLDKILKAKTDSEPLHKGAVKVYASTGQAIIHPPKDFNLPDMMLHAFHDDIQSKNGGGDSLIVFLWLETSSGFGFVPVAIIGSNPSHKILKKVFQGTPAGENLHILGQDKFSVRVHGNTLFAMWTDTIPLIPSKYKLPPSCFSLEGFGKIKTGTLSVVYRSGFKNWIQFNAMEALVSFFHPSSKYSGPGTDGILFREFIGERFIPKKLLI